MQEGKKPYSVGLFFSLGHSTIVVLASGLIAVTAAAMKDSLDQFHDIGGLIGTAGSSPRSRAPRMRRCPFRR